MNYQTLTTDELRDERALAVEELLGETPNTLAWGRINRRLDAIDRELIARREAAPTLQAA